MFESDEDAQILTITARILALAAVVGFMAGCWLLTAAADWWAK